MKINLKYPSIVVNKHLPNIILIKSCLFLLSKNFLSWLFCVIKIQKDPILEKKVWKLCGLCIQASVWFL